LSEYWISISKRIVKSLEFENGLKPPEVNEGIEFAFTAVSLDKARYPGLRVGIDGDNIESTGGHSFGVVFITQGNGTCVLDADSYQIEPNSVLFLRPNQRIVLEPADEFRRFEILFSEEFLTLNEVRAHRLPGPGLFDVGAKQQVYRLSEEEAKKALRLIDDISQEYDLRHPAYVTALRSFLIVMLLQFWRCLSGKAESGLVGGGEGRAHIASRFQRLVAEEPRLDRTVTFYAGVLEISAGHLHELVKDATGETPISVVQREVILEAKRLLIHTTRQIADIAKTLAFKDASYFGRYFRRNTGLTPGRFRQQSRHSLGMRVV
jgi:AraC family transcriptional regulator, transcriptional activator of pobA